MFTPDQQSTALPPMLVRLFSVPAVTPLFRDALWGGLSLMPLITVIQVCLLTFCGLFNCWCEENTGNTSKAFILLKVQ